MENNLTINKSRILASLFWIYGVIALVLGLILNQYILEIFSQDKLLCAPTVSRIHHVQAILLLGSMVLFGLGWILKVKNIGRRLSERKLNLLLSISLIIFILFCLETVLLIKFPGKYYFVNQNITPMAIYDKTIGYVLNPKLEHGFRINSLGFRGAEFNSMKKANEIRIVALGDSITFGWPLNDEASTYPYKLQLLLDKVVNGKKYNVINAGVPGYTSLNALNFMKSRVLPLKPDFIILCIGWNDLTYAYDTNWNPDMISRVDDIKDNASFSPAIIQYMEYLKKRISGSTKKIPNSLVIENFRSNLIDIIEITQKNDIGLLILNMPAVLSKAKMTSDEINKAGVIPAINDLSTYQLIVKKVCNQMGVPLLNIFDLEMSAKGKYFVDYCHPNSDGTAFMANQIAEFVKADYKLGRLLNLN